MARRQVDIRRIEVVDDAIAEILRRKTPAQRVQMIFDCNRTMRLVLEGSIRTFHPEWDDAMVTREVARRMLRETR